MNLLAEVFESLTVIKAKDPRDTSKCIYLGINPGLIQRLASIRLTTKIYEYCYNICGESPPVNLIGYHERGAEVEDQEADLGLIGARAIFRGIKRPFIDDGFDSNVYAFVCKPRFTYKYVSHMVCVAKRIDAPSNCVFVVLVYFENGDFSNGEVRGWDWVEADSANPNLPADYSDRYEQEVWRNGEA